MDAAPTHTHLPAPLMRCPDGAADRILQAGNTPPHDTPWASTTGGIRTQRCEQSNTR
jgi:hypothetical protein